MYTITLKGNSSNLNCDFCPPIEVSKNAKICLLGLQTCNSIPNINEKCNRIGFIIKNDKEAFINDGYVLPTGSYELPDLERIIKQKLSNTGITFELKANNITLKCEMKSSVQIDLSMPNNIGTLLGFKKGFYNANVKHQSETLVDIAKINCIYIESNLVVGSFVNGKQCHILHEFYPNVAPGYKIIEIPTHLVYYSLNCTSISHASIVLKDQNNELIDLRGEPISIRILIKDYIDNNKNGSAIL